MLLGPRTASGTCAVDLRQQHRPVLSEQDLPQRRYPPYRHEAISVRGGFDAF